MSDGTLRFTITSRLNNPATEFTLDYKGATTPPQLDTGNVVSFTISDPYTPNQQRVLRAYIENVTWTEQPANRVIGMNGRDIGLYLLRQSFKLDCNIEGTAKINKANDIMDQILTNTSIIIARSQPRLIPLEMPNQYGSMNWFCGNWKTKSDALDWLFRQYQRGRGMQKIRWYIDMSGDLRWFERHSRETAIPIFNDDPRIKRLTVTSNAGNIGNDVSVTGGDKGEIIVRLQDRNSINRFGLQEIGVISDSQLTTNDQVTQRAKEELSIRSKEIYTANLEMKHYVDYAPGMRFTFPERNKIDDEVFTLIGYTLTGEPANATATLELSTDETLINSPNTFEAIKGVVKDIMNDGKTELGKVLEKDTNSKTVLVETYHGGQRLVSRYA